MRILVRILAPVLAAASILATQSAFADRHIFIIPNHPDGYGIDQCLAKGDRCGAPMANAYCRQRNFINASEFRRVEPDEITGAVPDSNARKCTGFGCAEYVAITCQR